jgi:ribose transport system substrate-binding protein
MLFIMSLLIIVFALSCGGGERAKRDRTTVAVIPMGTTHEYWKAIHAGAVKAARELDIDIVWKGPLKEDDVDEQIQIVETLSASGMDAIVLAPLDRNALVRPVRDARRMGIPTVIVDSDLEGSEHAAFVSTNNYRGGVLGAEHLGGLMGGTGRLILVRVQEGSASSTNRERGFLDTIRSRYPGIEILSDNQYGGITTETAYRTCENLLNRFPDVEAIFTPNESTTFGCLRALQDRGLAGKILFVGFDSSEKLIEALAQRELLGLVVQNPFLMGYTGVTCAVAAVRGEPYEKNTDTGAAVATPDNMNDPDIQALLRPDLKPYLE